MGWDPVKFKGLPCAVCPHHVACLYLHLGIHVHPLDLNLDLLHFLLHRSVGRRRSILL